MMNVFEFAKKMELDGIVFYQQEAALTILPGFKAILQLLIDEEQKHYFYLDVLAQDGEPDAMPPFPAAKVENVFQQIRQNREGFDFTEEESKAYEKVLEIEKRSEKFYRDQAAQTTDEKLKNQMLLIAEEEKKHVMLFTDLVEYINRPEQWVEHADFSQPRKEY